jgi:hypothetical protein
MAEHVQGRAAGITAEKLGALVDAAH